MAHQFPKSWSGEQFKAARVWIGLTHQQLAEEAQVGLATVRRVEVSSDLSQFRLKTIHKIQNTLEDYGAIFSVPDNTLQMNTWNCSRGCRYCMESAVGILDR